MTSKFSFYDFFAMIIPGGIIMAAIWPWLDYDIPAHVKELCCGCRVLVKNDPPLWVLGIMTVVAYFMGLVNNLVADVIFSRFKNNRKAIFNELVRVARENPMLHLQDYVSVRKCHRKYKTLDLIQSLTIVWKKQPKHNPSAYYMAYYTLAENQVLGNVTAIEAQVALMRNSLFPVLLLFIALCINQNWCFAIFAFCFGIMLYIVMVKRQNKIYQMVWEAANYYDL